MVVNIKSCIKKFTVAAGVSTAAIAFGSSAALGDALTEPLYQMSYNGIVNLTDEEAGADWEPGKYEYAPVIPYARMERRYNDGSADVIYYNRRDLAAEIAVIKTHPDRMIDMPSYNAAQDDLSKILCGPTEYALLALYEGVADTVNGEVVVDPDLLSLSKLCPSAF